MSKMHASSGHLEEALSKLGSADRKIILIALRLLAEDSSLDESVMDRVVTLATAVETFMDDEGESIA